MAILSFHRQRQAGSIRGITRMAGGAGFQTITRFEPAHQHQFHHTCSKTAGFQMLSGNFRQGGKLKRRTTGFSTVSAAARKSAPMLGLKQHPTPSRLTVNQKESDHDWS
ncbi:hypothetical protein V8J88_00890 [Massilia sp. W12]|uniref:hypothetical protein n=1 Tax=Massilia sp. W12 TaxID=3126507 RepID=UPI0030CD00B8